MEWKRLAGFLTNLAIKPGFSGITQIFIKILKITMMRLCYIGGWIASNGGVREDFSLFREKMNHFYRVAQIKSLPKLVMPSIVFVTAWHDSIG